MTMSEESIRTDKELIEEHLDRMEMWLDNKRNIWPCGSDLAKLNELGHKSSPVSPEIPEAFPELRSSTDSSSSSSEFNTDSCSVNFGEERYKVLSQTYGLKEYFAKHLGKNGPKPEVSRKFLKILGAFTFDLKFEVKTLDGQHVGTSVVVGTETIVGVGDTERAGFDNVTDKLYQLTFERE